MREPATAHEFGRWAALDGWNLESARQLGTLRDFDPEDVEAGYRDQVRLKEQRRRTLEAA